MAKPKLPLGQESDYPNKYAPELLFPIPRLDSRESLTDGEMPFHGSDIWNAWDLTWLGPDDKPVVATGEFRIPAESANLIESKSLKLYLNSLSMSRFDSPARVASTLTTDLSACAGALVDVAVDAIEDTESRIVIRLPGLCIDSLPVACDAWEVDPTLLECNPDELVEEELHTHLLRSLCPVTAQPDIGSLAVHYRGPRIDPATLLKYVVSFREHNDFHEACIERMFVDLLNRCRCEKLSVFARYQRRGGIDINPFRSNFENQPKNARLWRQ